MSQRHLNPVGLTLLGLTAAADWTAHNAFTAITIAGVVVSSICQLGQLWFRYRDSQSARAQLKTKLFRQWEAAKTREG